MSESDRFDFPKEEERILAYWDSINAFETSLELSKDRPLFSFYDGPPFATGLPHYGHILAGTIKDTVLRYASQKGFHVDRHFGWDCHGLPIEHEIDKKLGITGKDDIMKMGIAAYNAECRGIVTRYTSEWEMIVKRSGRWIDFKNDFKTMYPSAMESVWWVFQSLFNKGLVYEGYKVMPYSTACTSPLSNFEANLNYKDQQDPAVVVSFPLVSEPETSLLIWTTTPWTLPSNLAIVAHPDFVYVKIKDVASGRVFIVLEKRLDTLYKNPTEGEHYEVIAHLKGSDLNGLAYEPLFPFYAERAARNNFTVVTDTYVTEDTGTGLVHCAPGFGEDDQRVALLHKLIDDDENVCPVDGSGRLTAPLTDFTGMYFKDADKEVLKALKSKGKLIRQSTVTHSYPFCWRSDTPLMYRAVPSWFVRVTGHIDKLLKNNSQTYWVPEHVKTKKFANWLENARDWAVSRNRYWGTPIPIWANEDRSEIVCIGSIAELERLSGVSPITDLHRESIDHIEIPSQRGPSHPPLRRVEEVFDCWFESGSVPYATQHYPFENKDVFERNFPADFIAEGIDQTRGWFYTLMVLSTLLFDAPPFKNLIVNGLVLAGDGKKMSKRLKNYPEPTLIMDAYGADALRLYLINSPVVCAEFLKFKEEGVKGILRDVFLPLVNAQKFLLEQIQSYERDESTTFTATTLHPSNVMDRWVLAALQSLVAFVRKEMDAYRLYTVVPRLIAFIEQLTNWYVRLNRRRLKGLHTPQDRVDALGTLFHVIFTLATLLGPFTPFLAENLYLRLKPYTKENLGLDGLSLRDERESLSVHFLSYPKVDEALVDPAIERAVNALQSVIEGGRTLREAHNVSLKAPLSDMIVLLSDPQTLADLEPLLPYIQDELNVRSVSLTLDAGRFGVSLKATPNFGILGKKYKKDLGAIQAALTKLSSANIAAFAEDSDAKLVLPGTSFALEKDEVNIVRVVDHPPSGYQSLMIPAIILFLNLHVDAQLETEALTRELLNRVQKLRKKAALKPSDAVHMFYHAATASDIFDLAVSDPLIVKTLKAELVARDPATLSQDAIIEMEVCTLKDTQVTLVLARLA